jgi:hypothetical protein
MQHLHKVLCDIGALAGCTPASVGESEECAAVVRSAEDNLERYSLALQGKNLYSTLYGTYTVTLNDFKSLLKASSQAGRASQGDGFKEVRSRKRHSTAEAARSPKKAAVPPSTGEVPVKNFFTPLRANSMDTDAPVTVSNPTEAAAPEKSSRQPPIVLTSAANLIQLQKQLKGVANQQFEFRSTRNGTRVVTKDMVDYRAVKTYFDRKSLNYFTIFPKSDIPIKAVLRHLPSNTPAQDISDGLVNLGFDIISVKCLPLVGHLMVRNPLPCPCSLSPCQGPENPRKYSNSPASATFASR